MTRSVTGLMNFKLVLTALLLVSCLDDGTQRGRWTVGPTTMEPFQPADEKLFGVKLTLRGDAGGSTMESTLMTVRVTIPKHGNRMERLCYLTAGSGRYTTEIFVIRASLNSQPALQVPLAVFDRRAGTVTTSLGEKRRFTPGMRMEARVDENYAIQEITFP